MSRRTIWLILGSLGLGAVIVVAALLAGRGTGEPMKVGVVYNDSGGMKWLDGPAHMGLQVAVDQINDQGGILGRPVETVEIDGTTDATNTTRLVAELVDTQEPVAVVGVNDPIHAMAPIRAALRRADGGLITFTQSELALEVSTVTEGVPFVTSGSTLTTLPDMTDGVFPVAVNQDDSVAAITRFARDELDASTVFVIGDGGNDYATTLARVFQSLWEQGGGEVVGSATYPPGELAIPSQIEEMRRHPAHAIFLASMPNDGGYLIRQIRDAGLDQPILIADVVDDRYIAAVAGEMDQVYMATQGSLSSGEDRIHDFVAAYEEAFGETPDGPSAMLGFDAMMLVADAIERAGSTSPGSLGEALASTDHFPALSGDLAYSREGHPVKPVAIVRHDHGATDVVATIGPVSLG